VYCVCIQTNVRSWRTSAQRTRDASTLMVAMSARPDVGRNGPNRKERSQNAGLGSYEKKSAKSARVTSSHLLSCFFFNFTYRPYNILYRIAPIAPTTRCSDSDHFHVFTSCLLVAHQSILLHFLILAIFTP